MRLKNHQSLKHIWSLISIGTMVGLISSCGKTPSISAQAQTKPKVAVSHNVICDMIDTIAEDTIDTTCLLDHNQDPHTFRPTPSDRQAIAAAQLVLYGGYNLESQLIDLIEAKTDQEASQTKIALFEKAIAEPIMASHEHGHEEHGHEEHGHEEHGHEESEAELELTADPHVWHSVENTVAMVEQLKSLLTQLNPQSAELYLNNSSAYTEQLWQLDAWIKEMIETIPQGQRVLVTTHSSLNYFVQAYNLEGYQTLQGISSDDSPSAAQVRNLVAKIKQANVPTIFAESTKSDRVINNVAREAEVKLADSKLYADGLGDGADYPEMMSHNTCTIVNGLGGTCQPFIAEN